MSNFKDYLSNLNESKMIQLIFSNHLEESGYKAINPYAFDLENNIIVELQLNNKDSSITLTDKTTNITTSYLFENSIAFKDTVVIKSQRYLESYYFDEIIEDINIYSLLDLVMQQKEIYLDE